MKCFHWSTECRLFVLGATCVLPTLWGTFVFDDGEAITSNEDVIGKSLRTGTPNTVGNIFKNDFWGSEITDKASHKSYRPLTILTYRWEHNYWGRNPLPFHFSNWILHGISCILVFHFLRQCYKFINQKDGRLTSDLSKGQESVILWASIVFSVHPVHVEPVAGLVGRADLISSLIFLLGFIATFKLLKTSDFGGVFFISAIGIFGSLFKENAITAAVLYIALSVFVRKDSRFSTKELVQYFIAVCITSSFIIWRLWFQGGPPIFQAFDNPPAFAPTLFSRTFSIPFIWICNFCILVYPNWSSFDWSMGCIDLIKSPWDFRCAFVILFFFIGIRLIFLSVKSRTILLALLIAGTTFLPSSNLIFKVGFVIAERNLYLPSIGFSLMLSYAALRLPRGKSVLFFVTSCFYLRSFQRSFDWISEDRLFLSALKVCPNNAKVHYNIGAMYGGSSATSSEAIESYEKAIQLKPDYYQAMNNLANILRSKNEMVAAETWLRKALHFKEDFAAAWMNLGIVLSKKNQMEALESYKNALKHRSYYPDCEYNVGNLYLDMDNKELALKFWIRAINKQPSHAQSWLNIIILLEQENRLPEAKDYAENALAFLGRNEDTLLFLLGNIHGRLEQYELGKSYFMEAIQICKDSGKLVPGKYWSNLGVLYHRWGRVSDARVAYVAALEVEPSLDSARKNLERLSHTKTSRI